MKASSTMITHHWTCQSKLCYKTDSLDTLEYMNLIDKRLMLK